MLLCEAGIGTIERKARTPPKKIRNKKEFYYENEFYKKQMDSDDPPFGNTFGYSTTEKSRTD